jgi:hypothetical protein
MEPLIDDDRDSLLSLVAALDASPRALRRDECGDWQITGKHGHVYVDGACYLLCVMTGESPRRWGFVKKRLRFCRLTQDGDDEGGLYLDRLPAPDEAERLWALSASAVCRPRPELPSKTGSAAAQEATIRIVHRFNRLDPTGPAP